MILYLDCEVPFNKEQKRTPKEERCKEEEEEEDQRGGEAARTVCVHR